MRLCRPREGGSGKPWLCRALCPAPALPGWGQRRSATLSIPPSSVSGFPWPGEGVWDLTAPPGAGGRRGQDTAGLSGRVAWAFARGVTGLRAGKPWRGVCWGRRQLQAQLAEPNMEDGSFLH